MDMVGYSFMRDSFGAVAVIGSGAVGIYYGARLAKAGADLTFVARSNFDAISKQGIRIVSKNTNPEFPSDSFNLPSIDVVQSIEELAEAEVFFVATKTTSNESIISQLKALEVKDAILVLLQNGIGEEEKYAAAFPQARVFGGVCFIGATSTAPNEVTYSGTASISIAPYERPGEKENNLSELFKLRASLVQLFENSGVAVRDEPNLKLTRWRKLIWNVTFNGLATLLHCNSGDVVKNDKTQSLARNLMAEVQAIARAEGIEIADQFIQQSIEITFKLENHMPSMRADYLNGARMEIESIFEEPLARARIHGVATPILEQVTAGLKFIGQFNPRRA